jgi:imidazolonepropionase-like amidohydrolase
MPGLIDCHVHVMAASANLAEQCTWSPVSAVARAAEIVRGMLHRGFTTVRDAGGAEYGVQKAIEDGLLEGPRLIFGGHALSQTGGHADNRSRSQTVLEPGYLATRWCRWAWCATASGGPSRVREEIKRGARHIKIMLSGDVASPTDRVDSTQFSTDEIRAARRGG